MTQTPAVPIRWWEGGGEKLLNTKATDKERERLGKREAFDVCQLGPLCVHAPAERKGAHTHVHRQSR